MRRSVLNAALAILLLLFGKAEAGDVELLYGTHLGGLKEDGARSVALDQNGNVWLTGKTESTNLPVTVGALQKTLAARNHTAEKEFKALLPLRYSVKITPDELGVVLGAAPGTPCGARSATWMRSSGTT